MAAVRVVVQFTADSPETADKAIAEAAERCKRAQKEPGCVQFEVFRSALDPRVDELGLGAEHGVDAIGLKDESRNHVCFQVVVDGALFGASGPGQGGRQS